MALIALASAKGSPGGTSLALALAHVWPRPVLLADCDPAGGDVAAGYLAGGVDPDRGLLGLTVAARRTDLRAALGPHLVALDGTGHRRLLTGLSDPIHASALAPWWGRLTDLFTGLGHEDPATDVLADCGRLDAAHHPAPLLAGAQVVAVVLRPTLRSVSHTLTALTALNGAGKSHPVAEGRLVAVLVGEGRPYTAREVTQALGVPVLTVAHDPRTAAVFSDGAPAGRRLLTSPLLRCARSVADQLTSRLIDQRISHGADRSPSGGTVPGLVSVNGNPGGGS